MEEGNGSGPIDLCVLREMSTGKCNKGLKRMTPIV